METIGLTKKETAISLKKLTALLADETVLYIKTRNFHWNLKGDSFMELHKLFEEQYNQIEETIDEVAERVLQLGGKAIGTMKEFIANANLKESLENDLDQKKMINELHSNHCEMCKILRDYIEKVGETKDFVTADFFTSILSQHEKNQWILGKYLTK
ncbi:Dps family protein [Flavobacterium sp.]|uniref:Dps family protein n=1 Tax=Flavobacterium sp. TaxID=239 RepID=UPI0035B4B0D2